MNSDLQLGDVCITQNGRTRICDRTLAVIVAIDATRPDEPYQIQRLVRQHGSNGT